MAENNKEYKQTAVQFLRFITAGRIDEAYLRYVNISG